MLNKELMAELERCLEENKTDDPVGQIHLRQLKRRVLLSDEAKEYIRKNRRMNFAQQLFEYIDRTGCKDSEIYKKALIDRRLFSKIRSNKNYIPSKKTVIALCIALQLSKEEMDTLMSLAGYSLSKASDYDLVIMFCMEKGVYDFDDINEILDYYGFELF